jgi:hypothetical protein
MVRLIGVSSFQWSTSEQVWPFEKTYDGKTLYCKYFQITMGGSGAEINHNISGGNVIARIRKLWGMTRGNIAIMGEARPLPFVERNDYSGYNVDLKIDNTKIMLYTQIPSSYNGIVCDVFVIYEGV